jgi:predicted nucleic acid-binding protein
MRTKTKPRKAPETSVTAFWDTSGIVPLCCLQLQPDRARQTTRIHSRQVVWWATPVEAISAFNRLVREGYATTKESRHALDRLEYLRQRWNEIQPTEDVRHTAERLLGVHKLRAADAFQLAAALVWCGNHPRGRFFICADGNLSNAADAEGFTVVSLS